MAVLGEPDLTSGWDQRSRGTAAVDPVQPGAPGTTGYNLDTYAANNPTTVTDPSGRAVLTEYVTLSARGAAVATLTVATLTLPFYYQNCVQVGCTPNIDIDLGLPTLGGGATVTTAPAEPTTLTPQALDEVAQALRDRLGLLSQAAAQAIAASCAASLAASQFVADAQGICSGDRDPVYFVGSADLPDINAHVARNHVEKLGTNVRLSYRGPNNQHSRRWLDGTAECQGRTAGFFCDEFPFASTNEGGRANYPSRVTLQPIDRNRNSSEGGFLGGFYRSCLQNSPGPFFALPTPSNIPIPTSYVGPGCSGPASLRS